MFEANDDIDVDDDFLKGVFDNEEEGFGGVETNIFQNDLVSTIEPKPSIRPVGSNDVRIPHILNRPHFSNSSPITSAKKDSSIPSKNVVLLSDANDHTPNSNKENKRKTSPPLPLRTKRERKFPGPAGLLPDRKLYEGTPLKLDSVLEVDNTTPNSSSVSDELCSQGRCSGSVLEDEPWQSLLSDLGTQKFILDIVNVANVKRKAAARCFVGKKVPFLAVVLHHLDVSSPDPCVILRDGTGEIHGTLHREVWDQFAGDLIVGSVLVVKNVGVLSTGLSSRRHYLNITANNLVTIYSANSETCRRARLNSYSKPDFNQVIENWRTLVSPSHGQGSPVSASSPALFNSSFGSPNTTSPVQNVRYSDGNLSRRIEINHRSSVRPENVRSKTAQNLHCSTPSRSSSAVLSVHSKPAARSLVPSFTHTTHQDNSPNVSKTLNSDKLLYPSTSLHKNSIISPSVNSKFNNPINSSNLAFTKKGNCSSKTSNFSPAIVKPNISRNELLFHRESNFNLNPGHHLFTKMCDTNTFEGNNNTKVTLSQTSELTAEEQSVMESVFDGIDADSLFDEDF